MLSALLIPFAACEAWPPDAERRAVGRILLGLAGAGLLGAAVGAATWVPAVDLLHDTARVADSTFDEEAAGWSLPPVRLFELAAPRLFGHVVPETVGMYWGRGLYGWRQWPYLFSIYGGLAALLLSSTAILARRRRDRPWLVAGGLGLLLAFGAHLPGWELLLRVVPPLAVVRFPEKWAVAPALVLALLAAHGLDLILRDERSLRAARALGLGAAAALAAATFFLSLSRGASWTRFWDVPSWLRPDTGRAVLQDFAVQLALAGVLAAVLFLRRRRELVLPVSLIALTAVDLTLAGRSLMPTDRPGRFDEPPAVLAPLLAAPRGERTLFQYADWKQHEVRSAGRQLLLEAPVPWQWGIATAFEKDFDGTHLAWSRSATRELLELMAREPSSAGRVLGSRGVNAVLRPPVAGEREALTLLAVREPEPFVRPAERVIVRRADESLAAATRRAGPALLLEPGVVAPATLAPVQVKVVRRSPTEIRLATRSRGESIIAINSSWHPGWTVLVNQEPAELMRRDGHLSALRLPPGEHLVLLRFRSPALTAGLLASALGLMAALGACLRPGRSRPSEAEPSPTD
jgi:hypothetical protein